jgi:phosphotransferase system HPr (HPr) family protein
MNFYLNYFKQNVMTPDDNPPLGVILCSDKDQTKVQFATAGRNVDCRETWAFSNHNSPLMNSIRYRTTNPWGLHARSAACVVFVARICAPHWEVIAAARGCGCEADAKRIMGVMTLAAGYGTEIKFFSLMPDEPWAQFTASLESLFFFITHHQRNKADAYAPIGEF